MASELEQHMVSKFGNRIDPEYIRALVRLKENNVNQRFLTPSEEVKPKKPGLLARVCDRVRKFLTSNTQ